MKQVCEECGAPVYETSDPISDFKGNLIGWATVYRCSDEPCPEDIGVGKNDCAKYCQHTSYTCKEIEASV